MLAEGIKGGFAMLYDTFAKLETLGVCRRGYFVEGMGGAQFALPGAVERLRGGAEGPTTPGAMLKAGVGNDPSGRSLEAMVLAAADPAQPYGAALVWPKRESQERRPARVAGAYVVLVGDEPALYVERGGRGLVTLADGERLHRGLVALADAVRAGKAPKLGLERINGQPAMGSELVNTLVELGFQTGPRRFTLSA